MTASPFACILLIDYSELISSKRRYVVAKRKNQNPKGSRSEEDKKLQALYAKMRKNFTAADLQEYTEIDEGVPARKILAEMEEIHRKYQRKRA